MSFLPDEILSKLRSKYTVSSLKTMEGQIKRLFKDLGKTSFEVTTLCDISRVTAQINKYDKTSTKKNTLQTLLVVIHAADPAFDDGIYVELLNKLRHEHAESYLMTEAKEKLITMSELVELREKYRGATDHTNYIRYLLLALFTYLPPMRGQDYYNTHVINTTGINDRVTFLQSLPYNFYDTATGILTLKDHKTVKSLGERKIEVPLELQNIINQWMHINGTTYLIPTVSGTQMSHNGFTDLVQRIFKPRNISIDHIRHAYVTEVVPTLSVDMAKKVAKMMGHSVSTQQMIYKKYPEH